jgi:hypothetical protein
MSEETKKDSGENTMSGVAAGMDRCALEFEDVEIYSDYIPEVRKKPILKRRAPKIWRKPNPRRMPR